ncbi:MAG TPA: chromosomal replication initiator protein DnaA [Planctomycetota bacterium]|nr:chromosomal replication initiator protein DnaA [Planctomycetota bacterium]
MRADLETRIRRDKLDTWFKHLTLASLNDKEVVFAVPSGFVRDFLTRNHLAELRRAVQNVGGHARAVRLIVNPMRPTDGDAARRASVEAVLDKITEEAPPLTSYEAEQRRTGEKRSEPSRAPENFIKPTSLNPAYTFESYVVGVCNRLSHAAALAIGENPGRAYNPFFIHGGVGLGKTHLLQAICHAVHRRHPGKQVAYLSCEEFTNQFINAVQGGKLDAFRERYRSVDVLVVDDVQFLANKDRTQDEFFHTFNALYNSHRQVVMSSDCAPFEIPTLEERLVSRFKWGLVTQLEAPCYETRYAIVQRKAKARNVEIPDEVARYIAETIDTNVRELEGAVVKLLGVATLTGRQISVPVAQEVLSSVPRPRPRRVTLDCVMNVIAREFSLSPRDITGKSRVSHISLTRQLGMYLSRHHTDHSLEEIGRFFGNRDHTTVIYGLTKIKKRMQEDRNFQAVVERLGQRMLAAQQQMS